MKTKIIDGKKIAAALRAELKIKVRTMAKAPCLVAIVVGDDPASHIYVKLKEKAAKEIGIKTCTDFMPASTSENELLTYIRNLNEDRNIDGILVQLPLPPQIDQAKILNAITPTKDVDGFHPLNAGRTVNGDWSHAPCTPRGVIRLLDSAGASYMGAPTVVIGVSPTVGRPTAIMLSKLGCTVTMVNSKTRNVKELCQQAEILVVAVGRPHMIRGDFIKRDSIIIDVGINRVRDDLIVGDVAFEECLGIARAITPVPGGVGPMTVACLMENTVEAAQYLRTIDDLRA